MRCYFAHPITDYGNSERQQRGIALIEAAGWTVENPDQSIHAEAYRQHGMAHFEKAVADCDALAFMRFPDGQIGAGVATEIATALKTRKPVFDLSSGALTAIEAMPAPVLTVEETRALIADLKSKEPRQ